MILRLFLLQVRAIAQCAKACNEALESRVPFTTFDAVTREACFPGVGWIKV